jgi:NAD(P)-dependent dehydrogenase (short-subunit alcohol dehydrogenase family)
LPTPLAKPDLSAWNGTKPDFAAWNGTNPCAAWPKWRPAPDVQETWDLKGRVAVVTGASSGIGAAIGAALLAEGVHVIGTSRTPGTATAPFDLLPLELSDPASVVAFGAAVAAHPAVVARGGLDILVNNAGRAVLGPVGPPSSITDYPAWMAGVWEGLQTNYLGAVRVTNTLWPLLQARAKVEDAGGVKAKAATLKKKVEVDKHYARVVFTASPMAWSSSAATPDLWGYAASQRALLIYANMLRAAVTSTPISSPPSAASKVKLSVLAPMATATRLVEGARPIFLDPTAAATDPAFLADIRVATAAGLDPAFVASAYVQVLKEDKPVRIRKKEQEREREREGRAEQSSSEHISHTSITHRLRMRPSGRPAGRCPPTSRWCRAAPPIGARPRSPPSRRC